MRARFGGAGRVSEGVGRVQVSMFDEYDDNDGPDVGVSRWGRGDERDGGSQLGD